MITGLSEKEASALARANKCACGQNLIVVWGDDFTLRDFAVRCLVEKGHTGLQIKANTRKLVNTKGEWEEYDVQTQKPAGTQEIVRYQTDHGQMELSVRQIQQYLCPKATEAEAYMFLRLCVAQKLNPFLKEVYLIVYGQGENRKVQMTVGRDAFIRRAEAHEQFAGFRAGIIVEMAEGNSEEIDGAFTPAGSQLLGGWSLVYRKDRNVPHKATVALSEYNTGQNLWVKMPATMIRKVAIVQGLREVFPTVYAGVDANVDIGDADQIVGEVLSDSQAGHGAPQDAAATQEASRNVQKRQASQQGRPAPEFCALHGDIRLGKHPELGFVHKLDDGSFCPGKPAQEQRCLHGKTATERCVTCAEDAAEYYGLPPSMAQDIEGLWDAVAAASLSRERFETEFLRMPIHEWLASGKTVRQALTLVPGYQMPKRGG